MEKQISTVGIVGAGKMGLSLFYYLLDFDFNLVLVCKSLQQKDEVYNGFQRKLNRELKKQLINEDVFQKKKSKVSITNSLDLLAPCDILIETITEDAAMKRQLFPAIINIVKPDCLLSSNSSSISAFELGIGSKIIGMHFFYPVSLKNIVEIMVCDETDETIIYKAKQFLKEINRKYILLKSDGAFLLNRIFLDFQNEAYLQKIRYNLSYEQIDAVVKKYFFPSGVFSFFDNVGLDVMLASIKNYSVYSSPPEKYSGLINEIASLTLHGFLGKKTGCGFYSYEEISSEQCKTIDADMEFQIYQRLKNCYVQTAAGFVEKGFCDKETINYAVKEYMDVDKGPFEID